MRGGIDVPAVFGSRATDLLGGLGPAALSPGAELRIGTEAGDFPKIVLGVGMMSVFVILYNRFLWRPLFSYAERRLRLS